MKRMNDNAKIMSEKRDSFHIHSTTSIKKEKQLKLTSDNDRG